MENGEQIRRIVEGLLKDKNKFWKLEEIEEYLKFYEIDNKKMVKILECLVDDHVFKWLDFISFILPSVASEKNFVNLLRKIIPKIKGDLAQGTFIRALIKIGEENPKLGFYLYGQMTVEKEGELIPYSSLLLGGAGRKNFDHAFSMIEEGLKNENPNLKAACIRALRVIFENEGKLKKSRKIFEILHRFPSDNEHMVVQIETLKAYFDFSRIQPNKCTKHLIKFATRHNSIIRFHLANEIWLRNLPNRKDEIDILKLCAEDEDVNVLSRISSALSKKGQEFPEKSLIIIKDWIIRGKYSYVYEIEYCLKEIGKSHLDRCIKEVETWIEERNDRLEFFIPKILQELSSTDYRQLIESVKTWLSRNETFWKTSLETIRAVLTEIFPPEASQEYLIDSCFSTLKAMAKEKNIDVKKAILGESDKFFQCFRLIEELELERQELDYKKIFENLKQYEMIRSFLGEKWFPKMEKEKNKTNPLLIFLSSEPPNEERFLREIGLLNKETDNWTRYIRYLRVQEMLGSSAFLEYLENLISIVSQNNKLRELKSGLRNEDQFWETISELEVISSFMKNYHVEIAPKFNGKKLDAKVEINGRNLLIEVINPNMFKPLRYLSGKALSVKNIARDKIFDEFKRHLKEIEMQEDVPIVIVIDISRSLIDYDSVEDYLMGTAQLTMLLNKEKGKVIKTFSSRAEDSAHRLEARTDILSAVVCYKRYLGKDGNFHIEGKIIDNKYAKNPLDSDLIEKISICLFR
jgi:hypothetical protein